MSTPAQRFLEALAGLTDSQRDKGTLFERLTCAWLRDTETPYTQEYSEVQLWREFAAEHDLDKTDIGIDLVARTFDDEYCAVQCKFLAFDYPLVKKDIDSFFTASGKKYADITFSRRLIVTTTANWSKHAGNAIENQQIHCTRLDFINELQTADIDWDALQGILPSYKPQHSAAGTNIGDVATTSENHVDLEALLRTLIPPKPQRPEKEIRPYQSSALDDVVAGFNSADRGKLIMACGTGKTYTALKIAEKMVADGGSILFLVPSLALLSQSMNEWSIDSLRPLRRFAVCSDSTIGKVTEDIRAHDLAIPVTTKSYKLAAKLTQAPPIMGGKKCTNVVFATYHSIAVVKDAQQKGVAPFDLIICDEAHRTTGVEGVDKSGARKESHFTKVHQADYLQAQKRLYMTATPRIYTEAAKSNAKEADATVYSMDDADKYGAELHRLDFSDAIKKGLLSDYQVLILAVNEHLVHAMDSSGKKGELDLGDTAKIIGCWNGLAGKIRDADEEDVPPMKRAVAFTQSIAASKQISAQFTTIVDRYIADNPQENARKCQVWHVDGTQDALLRNKALNWLKQKPSELGNDCHILSNVRCLSEGVDVPALDAVMFLNPRKSQVDIVQSVGRVMRKSKGKKYGYIILPICITAGSKPEDALHNNDNYKVPICTMIGQRQKSKLTPSPKLQVKPPVSTYSA